MKHSNRFDFGLQREEEKKVSLEDIQNQMIEIFGYGSVETSLEFSNEWN